MNVYNLNNKDVLDPGRGYIVAKISVMLVHSCIQAP